MRRTAIVLLLFCILLSGCSNPYVSSYVSVKPYEDQWNLTGIESVTVTDGKQLYDTLRSTVNDGVERVAITGFTFSRDVVDHAMKQAIDRLMQEDPIANYAVRNITYEWGKTGDKPALAVEIHYSRNRSELSQIKRLQDNEEANNAVIAALTQCESGLVFQVLEDEGTDYVRTAERFARENPDQVMELPQITMNVYPDSGSHRVVELRFFYQTDREALLTMKEQVEPVFTSAVLYVSGDAQQEEKYHQLHSFLMERYEYQLDTSITPAYSLLHHGVGDSKAFASVYAVMCRRSGLECETVSGTKRGESHSWNMIYVDGSYYHLDLLEGDFHLRTDEQMNGYVWDYSAYPVYK